MKKSNDTFRGVNVSIREHWTGEWEILDSDTGEIKCLVSDKKRALELYDKFNAVNGLCPK